MEVVQSIAIMVFTLVVLVAVHEFGHFWVARRCGVKVLRFSIGFGPVLPGCRWHDSQGTEYVIAAIPLGGYIKMLGEMDPLEADQTPDGSADAAGSEVTGTTQPPGDPAAIAAAGVSLPSPLQSPGNSAADGAVTDGLDPEEDRAFNRKPVSQRIAITAAGPIANLLLAVLAYWFVFMAGERGLAPVVGSVEQGSVAAEAGVLPGWEILAVDGEETPTWQAVHFQLLDRLGDTGPLALTLHDPDSGQTRQSTAQLHEWLSDADEPYLVEGLGIAIWRPEPGQPWPEHMLREYHYGPVAALVAATRRTGELMAFTLDAIKKMLTGFISSKNLSGPITIAQVAVDSAESGLEAYITFLALLSVSLGVLNLLPIPVLDGGHLLYYLIECLIRRPVPARVQTIGYQVGMVLILGIMFLAIYNDVARL